MYLQFRWQEIPEARQRAFKSANNSDEEVEIAGNIVKLRAHRVIDKYTPFDSALELNVLPCLADIICEQWHPDLIEFLRGKPFIDELTLLNHSQRTLDLRGTSIRKLKLDLSVLEVLWLNARVEQLLFQNDQPDVCTIHAYDGGSRLALQFISEYRPHTELPNNLQSLHGIWIKELDLTALTRVHPRLHELRLWGAKGNLRSFSAVAELSELCCFSTYDLFGFDAADIPHPSRCRN